MLPWLCWLAVVSQHTLPISVSVLVRFSPMYLCLWIHWSYWIKTNPNPEWFYPKLIISIKIYFLISSHSQLHLKFRELTSLRHHLRKRQQHGWKQYLSNYRSFSHDWVERLWKPQQEGWGIKNNESLIIQTCVPYSRMWIPSWNGCVPLF